MADPASSSEASPSERSASGTSERSATRAAAQYRRRYEEALFENVLPFWEQHSLDEEHGGYFSCLGRGGQVYDTTKYAWMQSRQAWTFATLYRDVDAAPDDWLALARSGLDFLQAHAVRSDGRVVYALTAEGQPVEETPPLLTECFYTMALAAFGRASEEPSYQREAEQMLERIWSWAFESPTERLPGQPPSQSFATPMILLNVIEEVAGEEPSRYRREVEQCVERLRRHVHAESQTVRENVSPEGALLEGPAGRLLNPGHGIEGGWFLRHWAAHLDRPDWAETADDMVRWSFQRGWDDTFGGLFTYLDAGGLSPVELPWHMKLWWPCCEALYAHLLRYVRTGADEAWAAFEQTDAYAFERFPDGSLDEGYGEWFGYLDRRGAVTHRFKGGPKKGCFHVPRTLWRCWRLLETLEASAPDASS